MHSKIHPYKVISMPVTATSGLASPIRPVSGLKKGCPLDGKREPINETGMAISYLVANDRAKAEPKLAEVD